MKKYLSYLYVVLGAVCWGLIGLFNRTLGELDVSVFQRVCIRNFGALLLLTAAVTGTVTGLVLNLTSERVKRILQQNEKE